MSFLDDIRARLTPESLLRDAGASGAGVRVCVVDSGMDSSLLAGRHAGMEKVEGGVFQQGKPTPLPYDGQQSTSHGTTVADIILKLAPRVRLFSADVFGPQGSCEVEVVIQALRHALDVWQCKVINLSLGVPESKLQPVARRLQLQRVVEEAYYRDVLIVAAADNDHPYTRSYPAGFAPPLLSVDKGLFDDPLQAAYRLREQIEFQAHGQGYLGPFAAEPATSWAAPHLTGIAARLLSLQPDLKPFEIKTLLYWMFRGH